MADLTKVGSAIASGYTNESEKPDCAFDASDSSIWNSSGTGLATGDYIGRNFGGKYTVQSLYYLQVGSNWRVNSIKLQYSDDGSVWTDIQVVDLTDVNAKTITVNSYPGGNYFRISANENSIWTWCVCTITLTGTVIDTVTRRRCVI